MKYKGEMDPFRHFEKENGKWKFINHQNACPQCASPWCKFMKNKQKVVNIVNKKKTDGKAGSNKQKRYLCYVTIVNIIRVGTNQGWRMRLGWCVENYVRSAFPKLPEEEYTGFKYGKNMCPSPAHSSDSETLYQK